jgi:putative FmdB family regulatory protein
MPLYDYMCDGCGPQTDVVMKIAEMEKKECPFCGQPFTVVLGGVKNPFRPFVHDNIDLHDVEITSKKQWKKELDKRNLISEYTH